MKHQARWQLAWDQKRAASLRASNAMDRNTGTLPRGIVYGVSWTPLRS